MDIEGTSGHLVVPVSQLAVLWINHQASGGLVHSADTGGEEDRRERRKISRRAQQEKREGELGKETWGEGWICSRTHRAGAVEVLRGEMDLSITQPTTPHCGVNDWGVCALRLCSNSSTKTPWTDCSQWEVTHSVTRHLQQAATWQTAKSTTPRQELARTNTHRQTHTHDLTTPNLTKT